MRVSINGRQVRSPLPRLISVFITALIVILAVMIGAAVLLPLIGLVLTLGLVGAGILLLTSAFRKRFGHTPPPPTPFRSQPDSDPEVVEDDRVAHAKPVERV